MRYLLDKVTARYIVQGLVNLSQNHQLNQEELSALNFFSLAKSQTTYLFIVPPTANVLDKLAQKSNYSSIIRFFLNQVSIALPTRYFKRWTRRLHKYGFTREDSAVIALGTFSTNNNNNLLGMNYIVTYDQPMINNWLVKQVAIKQHLEAMKKDMPLPYAKVNLPQIIRAEQIDF